MTKETVVKIANDLLHKKGDMKSWLEMVSDYCEEKDKKKASKVISMFPSLPQDIQLRIIEGLIQHYCRKFYICSLQVYDPTVNIIINGVQKSQYKPIYYFI